MKKLADISSFERLQGNANAGVSSDVSVFNSEITGSVVSAVAEQLKKDGIKPKGGSPSPLYFAHVISKCLEQYLPKPVGEQLVSFYGIDMVLNREINAVMKGIQNLGTVPMPAKDKAKIRDGVYRGLIAKFGLKKDDYPGYW